MMSKNDLKYRCSQVYGELVSVARLLSNHEVQSLVQVSVERQLPFKGACKEI